MWSAQRALDVDNKWRSLQLQMDHPNESFPVKLGEYLHALCNSFHIMRSSDLQNVFDVLIKYRQAGHLFSAVLNPSFGVEFENSFSYIANATHASQGSRNCNARQLFQVITRAVNDVSFCSAHLIAEHQPTLTFNKKIFKDCTHLFLVNNRLRAEGRSWLLIDLVHIVIRHLGVGYINDILYKKLRVTREFQYLSSLSENEVRAVAFARRKPFNQTASTLTFNLANDLNGCSTWMIDVVNTLTSGVSPEGFRAVVTEESLVPPEVDLTSFKSATDMAPYIVTQLETRYENSLTFEIVEKLGNKMRAKTKQLRLQRRKQMQ